MSVEPAARGVEPVARGIEEDLSHFADYEDPDSLASQVTPWITTPAPPITDVPAELILHLAMGLEEPADIAARHGFSPDQFEALCQWEPFLVQIEAKKAQLKQEGWTFRVKNAFYAEEIGEKLYLHAMSDQATFPQLLDAYKTTARLADLEPKGSTSAGGDKFSVTLNLGPLDVSSSPVAPRQATIRVLDVPNPP